MPYSDMSPEVSHALAAVAQRLNPMAREQLWDDLEAVLSGTEDDPVLTSLDQFPDEFKRKFRL